MTALGVFIRNRRATSAIEFALIAPVYFVLVWGILEIALISWFSTLINEGADRGAEYMQTQRMTGQPMTDAGIRAAVCGSVKVGGMSCDASKLKIAPYYAGVPVGNGFGIPTLIDNVSDPRGGSGGQYILAVGYNWDLMLPTSKLLLTQGPTGSQIQARTYMVLADKVSE